MDSETVAGLLSSGRRGRPGSMIASRMRLFEAAMQRPNDGCRNDHGGGGKGGGGREGRRRDEDRSTKEGPHPIKQLTKAKSMVDLVSDLDLPKTTPTRTEIRGVVCNPSTGQTVVQRVASSSNLLSCIRANKTESSTYQPHPQCSPSTRDSSTSSTDSDYSTGSQHSPSHDLDRHSNFEAASRVQSSPVQPFPTNRTVGNLKQFFEKAKHVPLSRASSLPQLAPSPSPPSSSSHPHKVPVLLPHPSPTGGPILKSTTLPPCLSQRHSHTQQAKPKTPLLPPVKQVRILDPRELPDDNRHDDAARISTRQQTHRKVPLLPPSQTPGVKSLSGGHSSSIPPPKPPRSPNRMQLHKFDMQWSVQSRPSPSTTDALPSKTQPQEPAPIRSRAKTFGGPRPSPSSSSSSSGPRSLRDYQQLSSRNQRKVKSPDEASEGGSTLPVDELQRYLVAYVNQELQLSPSIPSRGKALYDVCSRPANLCKLINKSVRNTVDLRALTTVSSNMSRGDREEAEQDNMTLTIESARAIGCRVTESTGDLILGEDPPTIRGFLIDLIRARVVHMPGMDDEPASTFTNLSLLFAKLGISESVDGGGGENGEEQEENSNGGGSSRNWREMDPEDVKRALETPPKSPPTGSWRDMEKPSSPVAKSTTELTYEERAAQRRAERERREKEREASSSSSSTSDTSNLTYEERAAIRRAERERRRKERAELASSH